MNHQSAQLTRRSAALLFFTFLFLLFTTYLDSPDLPWHIKTGEVILATGQLPTQDLFSFANDTVPFIGNFIFSQYWLSQVVLAVVHGLAGAGGLVLLRAALFTVIFILLWRRVRGIGFTVSLLFLGTYTAYMLLSFADMRPQLFTLLFVVVFLRRLDAFFETGQHRYLYPLPPLMCVWANLHGGYIFGILILGIGLVSAGIATRRKGHLATPQLNRRDLGRFFVLSLIATLGSAINPNHFAAFYYALTTHSGQLFASIMEYASPFDFTQSGQRELLVKFWATMPVSIVAIWLSRKQGRIFPALITLSAAAMSLVAVRYIPFLVLCTTFALGSSGVKSATPRLSKYPNLGIYSILVISLVGICSRLITLSPGVFRFIETPHYPVKAANFLRQNQIAGNIFASYNKAAYFILTLGPDSKVYYDSRFVSPERFLRGNTLAGLTESDDTVSRLLNQVTHSLLANTASTKDTAVAGREQQQWRERLSASGAEIVVHEALNCYSSSLYPIVLRLLLADEWKLIDVDGSVLIFLKDIPKFARQIAALEKPKALIVDELIAEAQWGYEQNLPSSAASLALGLLWKKESALEVSPLLREALARDPANVYVRFAQELYRRQTTSQ